MLLQALGTCATSREYAMRGPGGVMRAQRGAGPDIDAGERPLCSASSAPTTWTGAITGPVAVSVSLVSVHKRSGPYGRCPQLRSRTALNGSDLPRIAG